MGLDNEHIIYLAASTMDHQWPRYREKIDQCMSIGVHIQYSAAKVAKETNC